jgi:hypothetical protein
VTKRAHWLLILLGCLWLGVSGWNVAYYWSGGPLSSDKYLLSYERPNSWGDQHPECRDRFAYWPDGKRMDAKEARREPSSMDAVIYILKMQGKDTASAERERDVLQKIVSCEEAQWLPIAKANAIKRERIRLSAFALLPPFLLFAGTGLIRRATRIISVVAAKLIATAGALGIAGVVALFARDVTHVFNRVAIGEYVFEPGFLLDGPRLDVLCAILIPISIVLWVRRPGSVSERILACFMGMSAGLIPVLMQVFSLPLIRNSNDGVRAVAATGVFAAVVLSVRVTTYFLHIGLDKPSAPPALAPHIRTGLIRLYLVLLIPWASWFGYTAYGAHQNLMDDFDQGKRWARLMGMLEDNVGKGNPNGAEVIGYALSELGLMATVWNAKTNDEIRERIEEAEEHNYTRLTTAIYALLAGAMPPLLYPIFLWTLAGFRKQAPVTRELEPLQKGDGHSPQGHVPLSDVAVHHSIFRPD